jgi:UDP-sugar transporter A1/2/3
LIGACTSGLAGVYFEKMLKGAKTSLWIRQIQLGLGGLVIGTIGAYSQDGAIIAKNGFFQVGLGFGVWGLGFGV